IFVIDSREIGERCICKSCSDDTLGDREIYDEATCLHGARPDASAIAISQAGPASDLVQLVLERVTLAQICARTEAVYLVLDDESRVVAPSDRSIACPPSGPQHRSNRIIVACSRNPLRISGASALTNDAPMLGDQVTIHPRLVVVKHAIYSLVEL